MTDVLDILTDLRRAAEADGQSQWNSTPTVRPTRPTDPTGQPRPAALDMSDLRATLVARRSQRFFTDAAIDLADLTAMVRAGQIMDQALWPELHQDHPLGVFLAARSVRGLDRAVYRIDDAAPQWISDLPPEAGLASMVLQPEFAGAAALLLVTGSLAGATAAQGAHGHRILLARSGAMAETAWLAAVQRGLGGSIFAGFLPAALRSLIRVDGYVRTQLLAVAVGHPTGAAEPTTASASG